MAEVTLADFLEEIGLKPETLEDKTKLVETFTNTFIGRSNALEDPDIIKRIVGKETAVIEQRFKKVAKEAGIDFAGSNIHEQIDHFGGELSKTISTLKEAKGKPDKQTEIILQDYEKLKGDYGQLKGIHEQTIGELESVKKSKDDEIKSFKIDLHKKEVLSKIPIDKSNKALPYIMEGLETTFNKKFVLALNDQGETELRDREKGALIAKPNNNGFLSVQDAYTQLAEEAGILVKNNAASSTAKPFQPAQPQTQNNNSNPNWIHPDVKKRLESK